MHGYAYRFRHRFVVMEQYSANDLLIHVSLLLVQAVMDNWKNIHEQAKVYVAEIERHFEKLDTEYAIS